MDARRRGGEDRSEVLVAATSDLEIEPLNAIAVAQWNWGLGFCNPRT